MFSHRSLWSQRSGIRQRTLFSAGWRNPTRAVFSVLTPFQFAVGKEVLTTSKCWLLCSLQTYVWAEIKVRCYFIDVTLFATRQCWLYSSLLRERLRDTLRILLLFCFVLLNPDTFQLFWFTSSSVCSPYNRSPSPCLHWSNHSRQVWSCPSITSLNASDNCHKQNRFIFANTCTHTRHTHITYNLKIKIDESVLIASSQLVWTIMFFITNN